jgi:hypothetical protein
MRAVSIAIAVDSNAGAFRLGGRLVVAAFDSGKVLSKGLAATSPAGASRYEPHAVSLSPGGRASYASKAWAGGSGSAGVAGWGGASHRKLTPKNTPTVAAATASWFDADSHRGGGIGQVRNGLLAGGKGIRTLGPAEDARRRCPAAVGERRSGAVEVNQLQSLYRWRISPGGTCFPEYR